MDKKKNQSTRIVDFEKEREIQDLVTILRIYAPFAYVSKMKECLQIRYHQQQQEIPQSICPRDPA